MGFLVSRHGGLLMCDPKRSQASEEKPLVVTGQGSYEKRIYPSDLSYNRNTPEYRAMIKRILKRLGF
tara:strand:+ start:55 stop:255 length:201 start_codon:yes stop_codon:yes gene_type:complete